MVTEVIMQRELFGSSISQKSKSEFFSATDLFRAGNAWRMSRKMPMINMSDWLQTKSAKEFISILELKFGEVIISGRGRGHHTWVHPYLFIDMALAISPELKVEVYNWLHDYLLRYRNDSGDSYKQMCGSLYDSASNKKEFPAFIREVALEIQKACGVEDWQKATEGQLKLRDKIHEAIANYTDVIMDNKEAVRLGIIAGKRRLGV